MATLDKFEVVKFGPYRFIGKSVYARSWGMCASFDQTNILGGLCRNCKCIFDALEDLSEYATDEIHKAAMLTWDKYDEKNQLLGHTVGRFMKTDTPVPDWLDYIDIPEVYVAKAWWKKLTLIVDTEQSMALLE